MLNQIRKSTQNADIMPFRVNLQQIYVRDFLLRTIFRPSQYLCIDNFVCPREMGCAEMDRWKLVSSGIILYLECLRPIRQTEIVDDDTGSLESTLQLNMNGRCNLESVDLRCGVVVQNSQGPVPDVGPDVEYNFWWSIEQVRDQGRLAIRFHVEINVVVSPQISEAEIIECTRTEAASFGMPADYARESGLD